MKATSEKASTTSNTYSSKKPFFNKSGEGSFFSQSVEAKQPFFNYPTIQPKLTIGQPNDKYEQEADTMAGKVMKMPQSSNTKENAKDVRKKKAYKPNHLYKKWMLLIKKKCR